MADKEQYTGLLPELLGAESTDTEINILGKLIKRIGQLAALAGVGIEIVNSSLPGIETTVSGLALAGLGYAIDKYEEYTN